MTKTPSHLITIPHLRDLRMKKLELNLKMFLEIEAISSDVRHMHLPMGHISAHNRGPSEIPSKTLMDLPLGYFQNRRITGDGITQPIHSH